MKKIHKIPGPAGILPPVVDNMDDTSLSNFSDANMDTQSHNLQTKLDLYRSPWIQTGHDPFTSQWLQLENDLSPHHHNLLTDHTIATALLKANMQKLTNGKIPLLFVVIESLQQLGDDALADVKDKSGHVKASIHREVVQELGADLTVGTLLILKQTGVISPYGRRFYLNVTANNVIRSYPANKPFTPSLDSILEEITKVINMWDMESQISNNISSSTRTVNGSIRGLYEDIKRNDIMSRLFEDITFNNGISSERKNITFKEDTRNLPKHSDMIQPHRNISNDDRTSVLHRNILVNDDMSEFFNDITFDEDVPELDKNVMFTSIMKESHQDSTTNHYTHASHTGKIHTSDERILRKDTTGNFDRDSLSNNIASDTSFSKELFSFNICKGYNDRCGSRTDIASGDAMSGLIKDITSHDDIHVSYNDTFNNRKCELPIDATCNHDISGLSKDVKFNQSNKLKRLNPPSEPKDNSSINQADTFESIFSLGNSSQSLDMMSSDVVTDIIDFDTSHFDDTDVSSRYNKAPRFDLSRKLTTSTGLIDLPVCSTSLYTNSSDTVQNSWSIISNKINSDSGSSIAPYVGHISLNRSRQIADVSSTTRAHNSHSILPSTPVSISNTLHNQKLTKTSNTKFSTESSFRFKNNKLNDITNEKLAREKYSLDLINEKLNCTNFSHYDTNNGNSGMQNHRNTFLSTPLSDLTNQNSITNQNNTYPKSSLHDDFTYESLWDEDMEEL